MSASISPPKSIRITYDGGCPACNLYFMFHRLGEQGVSIEFADAREHPELILEYSRLGVNLNRDFVLDIDGTIYIGSEAMRQLANFGTGPTIWSKLNSVLFRHKVIGKILYCALRLGRYALLFLLGRRQLSGP
jgi:predicted DCC family thiol-disulfide oxidoreductase YuxK